MIDLFKKINIYAKKYRLLKKYLQLKKWAQSLAYLTLLLNKWMFNIPIETNKTQIKSYNDVKSHFSEKQSLMWEVSNIQTKKSQCKTNSYMKPSVLTLTLILIETLKSKNQLQKQKKLCHQEITAHECLEKIHQSQLKLKKRLQNFQANKELLPVHLVTQLP